MDPIQNALAAMLNALQAASAAGPPDVAAPQLPALMALVGKDVKRASLALMRMGLRRLQSRRGLATARVGVLMAFLACPLV